MAQAQGSLSTALGEAEVVRLPTMVALQLNPKDLGCAAPGH